MTDSKAESNINSDFLEKLTSLASSDLTDEKNIKKLKKFLRSNLKDDAADLREDYKKALELLINFEQTCKFKEFNISSLNSIDLQIDLLKSKKGHLQKQLNQVIHVKPDIDKNNNSELSAFIDRTITKVTQKLTGVDDKKLEIISKNLFTLKLKFLKVPTSPPTSPKSPTSPLSPNIARSPTPTVRPHFFPTFSLKREKEAKKSPPPVLPSSTSNTTTTTSTTSIPTKSSAPSSG